jgi:hypothetical protein
LHWKVIEEDLIRFGQYAEVVYGNGNAVNGVPFSTNLKCISTLMALQSNPNLTQNTGYQ